MTIPQLLSKLGATVSMSEGRRIVWQGAVTLNGSTIRDFDTDVDFHVGDIVKVGKHEFHVGEKHLNKD